MKQNSKKHYNLYIGVNIYLIVSILISKQLLDIIFFIVFNCLVLRYKLIEFKSNKWYNFIGDLNDWYTLSYNKKW